MIQSNTPPLQVREAQKDTGFAQRPTAIPATEPGLKSRSLSPFQRSFLTPTDNACPVLLQRHSLENMCH